MWIYFVEQVWNYEGWEGIKSLGWVTDMVMRNFWEDKCYNGYLPKDYESYEWMEEGNDFEIF
jgi:hypothetical protein